MHPAVQEYAQSDGQNGKPQHCKKKPQDPVPSDCTRIKHCFLSLHGACLTAASHKSAHTTRAKNIRTTLCKAAQLYSNQRRMQNAKECGMRNAECGMPNAECGMPNAECGMPNA